MYKKYLVFTIFAAIFATMFYMVQSGRIYSLLQDKAVLKEFNTNCELSSGICKLSFEDGKNIILDIPRPAVSGKNINFSAKTDNFKDDELLVNIYGINMDMGFFEYKLQQVGNDTYQGEVLLPSCMHGKMKWKVNVISKKEGASFGFILDLD